MSSSPARYFPGLLSRHVASASRISESTDASELRKPRSEMTEEIPDDLLIARLQKEDMQALGLLYQRYARLVYSVGVKILRNSAEAEDLVHEVFLALYRKCRSFDPARGAARSWIIQLTYSRCFDLRDYLKIRHGTSQEVDLPDGVRSGVLSVPPAPDPAYFVLWNAPMVAAFEALSQEQRECLRFFYFKGYTYQEIADETGHTYGNVKHHVYRGIERLRQLLYDDGQKTSRLAAVGMQNKPGEVSG